MPQSKKYICECKAVTYPTILHAIRKSGALTLLDIQNLTKASTGCGRCNPTVIQVLQKELGVIDSQSKQLRIDF